MKDRTRAALPLLVAALSALPFLPSLPGVFLQWDDAAALIKNDSWRGFGLAQLRWMWTTFHMGPWQPLSWMTYALDHAVWGMDPLGYRLTNLLLHAGGAALAFLLFEELLRAAAPARDDGERRWAAAFGALFFAVHPLRVESVCWISERRDVLCGAFYLLSLFLYTRRARTGSSLLPCFLAFVAACLSKGSALTLPLTLVILDFYPLRRSAWAEKVPFLAVTLLVGLIGALGQRWSGALNSLQQVGLGERLAISAYGLWWYAATTFWPSSLSPVYPIPDGFGPVSALPALAALAAAAAAAWTLRRRAPAFAAALAHHAAAAAPVVGAVSFGSYLVADHHGYLPGVGWSALMSAGFVALPRGRGRAVLAALVIFGLGAVSARMAPRWRDDLPLWTWGVDAAPASTSALTNMAHALRAAGREDEAAEYERRLVEVDPSNAEVRNNYGAWLLAKGRVAEALAQLTRAAELLPGSARVRYNLGMALRAAGKQKEGLAELRRSANLDPAAPETLNNLGLALLADGDAAGSLARFAAAARSSPRWAVPRHNKGNALTALGRHAEAARAYAEATELDPTLEEAWVNGGNALARSGRLAEAARSYRRALALKPADDDARRNLAAVLGARR